MTQASPQAPLNSSRLVRFLGKLGTADAAVSHEQFARRLGELIDLSDSIRLSATHAGLRETGMQPCADTDSGARADFLRVRTFLVEAVIKSFSPTTGTGGIRLPKLADDSVPGDRETRDAYLRFYVSHQREMGFKISNLHTRVRESVAGKSPRMAQLSALDEAIGKALSSHTRRYFVVIPRLLSKRYDLLMEDCREAAPAAGTDSEIAWREALERFRGEMRELLLAEIEARLLPVMGLVEALDEELDTGTL